MIDMLAAAVEALSDVIFDYCCHDAYYATLIDAIRLLRFI